MEWMLNQQFSFLFLSAVISLVLLLLITNLVKLLRLYLSIISCRARFLTVFNKYALPKNNTPCFSPCSLGWFLGKLCFCFSSNWVSAVNNGSHTNLVLKSGHFFFLLPIKNNKKRKHQQHVEGGGDGVCRSFFRELADKNDSKGSSSAERSLTGVGRKRGTQFHTSFSFFSNPFWQAQKVWIERNFLKRECIHIFPTKDPTR